MRRLRALWTALVTAWSGECYTRPDLYWGYPETVHGRRCTCNGRE